MTENERNKLINEHLSAIKKETENVVNCMSEISKLVEMGEKIVEMDKNKRAESSIPKIQKKRR